jgi:hypothetical protein
LETRGCRDVDSGAAERGVRVDDFQNQVARGIVATGRGEQRLFRFSLHVMNEFVVEPATDAISIELDFDAVPATGFDSALNRFMTQAVNVLDR